MNATTSNNWQVANQAYLMTALAQIREALVLKVDTSLLSEEEKMSLQDSTAETDLDNSILSSVPSALERLCTIFALSEFEQNVLLLCAGVELDARFVALCAAIQGDEQHFPTCALAMTALKGADWRALTPAGALRRWRLIEVGTGSKLMSSPLRIDERVLHYLMGVQNLDEHLLGIVEPVNVPETLVLSHQSVVEQMVSAWSVETDDFLSLPVLQLCGTEVASKRAIAAMACHYLELNLYTIAAHNIPIISSDLNQFKLYWEREVALGNCVLLIDCDEIETGDFAREGAIAQMCEWLRSPLIIATTDRRRARLRPLLAFDIKCPTTSEQYEVWQVALGAMAQSLNGQIDTLVTQFNLSVPIIQAACSQVLCQWQHKESHSYTNFKLLLWDNCRTQARPRLDNLAQRVESALNWEDLVLPEAQLQVLKEISSHVKHRAKVYEHWGFGGKSGRGLGISALFSGSSGTGKTMAAEVIAQELRLDLYRIDLSAVISKYIGETEKNLRRIFDAAELGGVILLFDEADALFGKRTEVKDSHDRHANVEVSYLLQRMEAYRGLSVLTTNLKNSLDPAFLRRIRFVVQFPFPDATRRAEIWLRVFPKATPTQGLDTQKLGQLNVAGGNIRNIALNAAFLAASAEEPVTMKHILQATKSEYIKLERQLTDVEIRDWVCEEPDLV